MKQIYVKSVKYYACAFFGILEFRSHVTVKTTSNLGHPSTVLLRKSSIIKEIVCENFFSNDVHQTGLSEFNEENTLHRWYTVKAYWSA